MCTLLALLGEVYSAKFAAPLVVVLYVGAGIWHVSGLVGFPGDRRGIQANKHLVGGLTGRAYFGALLGIGILTEMSTPLVWTGVIYSMAAGIPAAPLYGMGFGLGRSAPAVAAIPAHKRPVDYGAIAVSVAWALRRPLRYAGAVTGAGGAFIAVTLAIHGWGIAK
jgi:hypothetical protein